MRLLPRGIYTPLPCFFHDNEDVDIQSFKNHVKFTAKAGTVPVVSGSMGEAVHLSHDERKLLIEAARDAMDEAALEDMPVVVGVGAASTRESIKLAHDASDAGADFVMIIPPGYYASALLADTRSIKEFFIDVANASPLPVILYNFPAVAGGIDIDSDLVIDVVKASSNICGIKLSCANVGKLTRILAETSNPEFIKAYPRKHASIPFTAIDGFIDFLLPSISVGAGGAISGLPNIAPLACVKLWSLCQLVDTEESRKEARDLQNLISLADGVQLKIGVSGMKKLLSRHFGYNALPRRPLLPMNDQQADVAFSNPHFVRLLELEASLKSAKSV